MNTTRRSRLSSNFLDRVATLGPPGSGPVRSLMNFKVTVPSFGNCSQTNQTQIFPATPLQACGGGMSNLGKDRSARVRIRCKNHAESGTCPDPKTHYLDAIEQEVLTLLREALQKPERVQKHQKERRRLMGSRSTSALRWSGGSASFTVRLIA
jgi:hypothetical protein